MKTATAVIRFSALALLTILFSACPGRGPESSGTLKVSEISDPKTFNPVTARDAGSSDILGFVFESLVRTNAKTYEVEPSLADTWSVSADGRLWTFFLRRDVTWSDGAPFTSDDVLFTYNGLIFDSRVASGMADLLQMDGKSFIVSAPDSFTVTFHTHEPFAPFLRTMGAPIVPAHRFRDVADFNQALGINTTPGEVIGTGAFRIAEFTPGQRVVLEANPRYWQRGAGGETLPRLKKIVVQTVSDRDAEIEWFKAGRTDYCAPRGHDWPVLSQNTEGITLHNLGPRFSTSFVFFNQSLATPLSEAKKRWFRDRRFREAVAWAVDRRAMIDGIFNGLAFEQHSPIPDANTLFFDSGVTRYGFDLDRAASMLVEAGFRKNGEGELEDAQGERVAFSIMTNAENNERVRMATVICDGLKRLGIDARVNAIAFNTLVDRIDHDFDWDACLLGFTSSIEPHNGSNVWRVEGDLHSFNQKPRRPPEDARAETRRDYERNLARWREGVQPWEREIERLMAQGVKELDRDRRWKVYSAMQRLVSRELPFIYTVSSAALYATRDRVRGFEPSALGSTPMGAVLHNAELLSVD